MAKNPQFQFIHLGGKKGAKPPAFMKELLRGLFPGMSEEEFEKAYAQGTEWAGKHNENEEHQHEHQHDHEHMDLGVIIEEAKEKAKKFLQETDEFREKEFKREIELIKADPAYAKAKLECARDVRVAELAREKHKDHLEMTRIEGLSSVLVTLLTTVDDIFSSVFNGKLKFEKLNLAKLLDGVSTNDLEKSVKENFDTLVDDMQKLVNNQLKFNQDIDKRLADDESSVGGALETMRRSIQSLTDRFTAAKQKIEEKLGKIEEPTPRAPPAEESHQQQAPQHKS